MRLFVGGLAYTFTEADLKRLFTTEDINVQEATIILDRSNGNSKGFGFVSLDTTLPMERVLTAFNNRTVGTRCITVKPAFPKGEKNGTH